MFPKHCDKCERKIDLLSRNNEIPKNILRDQVGVNRLAMYKVLLCGFKHLKCGRPANEWQSERSSHSIEQEKALGHVSRILGTRRNVRLL